MDDQETDRERGGVKRVLRLAFLMVWGACVGFFFSPALAGSSWMLEGQLKQQLLTVVSAALVGLAMEFFLRFREHAKIAGLRYSSRDLLIAMTAVAVALGMIIALRKL